MGPSKQAQVSLSVDSLTVSVATKVRKKNVTRQLQTGLHSDNKHGLEN